MLKLGLCALLCIVCSDAALAREPDYSLPWLLRPAEVDSSLRADIVVAPYQAGVATVTLVGASIGVGDWGVEVVAGRAKNVPEGGTTGEGFVNPRVTATYAPSLSPTVRLALSLGATAPVGSGGGDSPAAEMVATNSAGNSVLSGMDPSLFAVNDVGVIPGVDLAWSDHGVTVQAEVSLEELVRVRGAASEPDASGTAFLSGVYAGVFVAPTVSIGAEARYQRWLSTPAEVAADGDARDNLTASVGARGRLVVGGATLRPGISASTGLRGPVAAKGFQMIQVDFPISF